MNVFSHLTHFSVVDLRDAVKGEPGDAIEHGVQKIYITDAVMLDVSATDIRRAAADNSDDLNSLVPGEVAEYIRKYQLYRKQA